MHEWDHDPPGMILPFFSYHTATITDNPYKVKKKDYVDLKSTGDGGAGEMMHRTGGQESCAKQLVSWQVPAALWKSAGTS